MSKQLAISAAFSVFAMAAFVLSATTDQLQMPGSTITGAKAHASAPVLGQAIEALPLIGD